MSDPRHAVERPERPERSEPAAPQLFDREIDLRAIFWTAVSLAGAVALSCLLMWWLFLGLRRAERANDPPPSPLPEAGERRLPPLPRLQPNPAEDMRALRAREEELLNRPAWVDPKQGTMRIPIDLAMDVLVRKGGTPR
ncbi:MAG TPA: hypothetical protein VOA87_02380 [Thermoanaerobaculia bacterium]|nr:hypothetical protein [Thermoanaerobaculia bacterium]